MVNEGSPGFGRVADCRVLTAVLVERGDGRTLGFEFLELIFEGIDCAEVVLVGDVDTDMRLICREGCAEAFLLAWGELACVRRAKEAGFDRGDRPCARSDRSCLAGRGDAPHLERRQRASHSKAQA